jgi:muramoyltetrapeptide carboxypeptidase
MTNSALTSIQLPPPLQPGDLLYVIATSGALRELNRFESGLALWCDRGYSLKVLPDVHEQWGYLAGTDEQRRHQLLSALKDPQCRGILCTRGGYGGTRLLEDWQWPTPLPGQPPKWLIGFSDITSLLWSLYQQGISGVHGPVLTTLAAEPPWSVERLFQWVEHHTFEPLTGESWVSGQATGTLLPANLTVATCLLGTPYEPNLDNVILAIEDVSEAPYRIDRMLTQWRMSGKLQTIKGIALGRFSQCEPPPSVPSFSVQAVLQERLSDLGIPIVANLPFGHDGPNAPLPVGIPVKLNGDQGTLEHLPPTPS